MAKVTFRSETQWSGRGVQCDVRARNHRWVVDEPVSLGGTDEGPNPVELVLGALGSCLTVLGALQAPNHGVDLKGFRVRVEGDLDPDGFMEKAPVRPGFQEIRARIEVDTPSSTERVEALVEHIERICPVKDTLMGVPVGAVRWEILPAERRDPATAVS